jgi:hypothetical protein
MLIHFFLYFFIYYLKLNNSSGLKCTIGSSSCRGCSSNAIALVGGLRAQASVGVGDFDVELRGSLHDQLAGLGRGGVSDLARERAVLHHQHLEFLFNQRTNETILVKLQRFSRKNFIGRKINSRQ